LVLAAHGSGADIANIAGTYLTNDFVLALQPIEQDANPLGFSAGNEAQKSIGRRSMGSSQLTGTDKKSHTTACQEMSGLVVR
jgi:hypothetical protein